MKPRKEDETDAEYIARLEVSNKSLRDHNTSLTNWCKKTNEAVRVLSTEGSLVFQSMAELAGVRSHPSVTQAVQMFDAVAFPQYGEPPAAIDWPDEWDFTDPPDAHSGDADAALNAPLAELFEIIEHAKFSIKSDLYCALRKALEKIEARLGDIRDQVKERHGFRPKALEPLPNKRVDEMTEAELKGLADAMGWAALDLAQDMHFSCFMLRRDLRASAFRRICADLYALSNIAIEPRHEDGIDIHVFGDDTPF
jgi:hypothetical protein